MIPSRRRAFNRGFDPRLAQRVRRQIEEAAGVPITFPLADTPVFVPRELADRLVAAVRLFFRQIDTPEFQQEAAAWVPAEYRGRGGVTGVPQVSQFDFAVVSTAEGRLGVQMLECQGCSSLMGVVPWYGHLLCEVAALEGCSAFLSHASWEEYRADLERVLGHSVLVDVDADNQKLRTDFWVLHRFAGVEVADLNDATLDDLERRRPRIYNRVVPIEAERLGRGRELRRFYRGDHDWLIHPEWYFRLNKRALRRLRGLSDLVPETVDLTDETLAGWAHRSDVVLKPANDFAGHRINLAPRRQDLEAALASGEPWVLQHRVSLVPSVRPPDGPALLCDLRVLCLEDRPVALFCRLARDPLCNISFNGHFPWCGITVGLVAESDGEGGR